MNNVDPQLEPATEPNRPKLHLVPPEVQKAEPETQVTIEVKVENTLAQVVDAFSRLPQWRGVLGFNEFSQSIVFRRLPPFEDDTSEGRELREEDVARIRLWFETEKGQQLSTRNVLQAAAIVARRNRFHPVREYLTGLSWDGEPRVATWLETFCSVKPASQEHRQLIRAVSRKWLISCVARAMKPGCKVDTMLILEGKQGIGKSSALSALAGSAFFCDSPIDFRSKDALQNIQGVWIYELAELDAILRGENPATKAFLSHSTDKFRAPYARTPTSVPRSTVFCGTVNHGGYLKDATGNRRFWIVRCGDSIDVEGLQANRHQLWAEARSLYEVGEPWHLSPEEDALMHAEHQERMEDDPWEERIARWVANRGNHPLAIDEVLDGALGIRAATRNPNLTRRVSAILEQLGFERQRKSFAPGTGRSYRYVHRDDASLPHCPTGLEETLMASEARDAAVVAHDQAAE